MAVQIPDPGQGDNKTGDNEYVFRKKVQNNFSDQTNAASRLVGTANGQIPIAENTHKACLGNISAFPSNGVNLNDLDVGTRTLINSNSTNIPKSTGIFLVETIRSSNVMSEDGARVQVVYDWGGGIHTRAFTGSSWAGWSSGYTNKNTTTDGNGYIKPSSPVLRVFNDHTEGNDDGDTMAATYTKNGVGDYTISGTTGLRSDGWYITIPNDINGNPHVAVTLDDTDGVITLKTYVRIFDMDTFKFVPDLNQPLDIPDGRWIDLRFNDLPIDDVPPEV